MKIMSSNITGSEKASKPANPITEFGYLDTTGGDGEMQT
jgi:hypothetical protein